MHSLRTRLIAFKLYLLGVVWRIKYTLFREAMPKNKDGKVYLNLGSGDRSGPEFINMDAVPSAHTHIRGTILDLHMFPSNSVDLIYASHVIEHIPRSRLEDTLREWHRVLTPGGTLRFGVPDFDGLIEIYRRSGNDTESIVNQLLGQDGEYDDHHTIWNRAYAEQVLSRAGFTDVRTWDPKTADHHSFKDKTSRTYADEAGTVSISLNLEATKK